MMSLKKIRLSAVLSDANAFLYVLLIGLFIAARLWRLTTFSLRADEIFSLKAARHSWSGLFSAVIADVVHPPIFYILLKSWIFLGGQSERWLRLLPVLTAVACIVPFTFLCRELGLSRLETNFALLLVSVNGYLIYYSQELRMYSLLMFLSLASVAMFVRFLRVSPVAQISLVPLFLINLCLIYTQYYGWMVVFVELTIVFISRRQEFRRFLLSVVALALCFSPWAYLVGRVAAQRGGLESNIGSFPRPSFVLDVAGFYETLSGDFSSGWKSGLGLALCLIPIVLWAISTRENSESEAGNGSNALILCWLCAFAFLPALLSYAFSQLLPQSVWGQRFLIIAAIPYLILVTIAAFRLRFVPLKAITLSAIAAWAVLSSVQDLRDSGKNAWKPVVYQMMRAEQASQGPVMVYTFDSSDETIQFYLDEAHDGRFRTVRISRVEQMKAAHFWVELRSSPDALIKAGFVVGPAFRDGFGAGLFQISARGARSQ